MPLLKMVNTKPNSKDYVQISFTATSRNICYFIKTMTWMNDEERFRGNASRGKFDTEEQLWDHIEKYISKKETLGFALC